MKFVNNIFVEPNPKCILPLEKFLAQSKKYRNLLQQVQARHPNDVAIFDTTKYLCDLSRNVCLPSKNNRRLYSYGDHISDYAAGMIGKDLNQFLQTY